MSWSITDRFPTWGEDGSFPVDGFFYEGGDRVNEKHLDALWNGIKEFENEVRSSLNDIDSDGDGVVDTADVANAISGVSHSELTDAPASAHHSKTTSASELSDVSADSNSNAHHSKTTSASELTDVSPDSDSNAHHNKTTSASELSDVSPDSDSNAHHSRYSDNEARSAVDADVDNAANSVAGLDNTVAQKADESQLPNLKIEVKSGTIGSYSKETVTFSGNVLGIGGSADATPDGRKGLALGTRGSYYSRVDVEYVQGNEVQLNNSNDESSYTIRAIVQT